jgi:hypothetical protein
MERMRREEKNENDSVPFDVICTRYSGDEGEALRHVPACLVRLCSCAVRCDILNVTKRAYAQSIGDCRVTATTNVAMGAVHGVSWAATRG